MESVKGACAERVWQEGVAGEGVLVLRAARVGTLHSSCSMGRSVTGRC